MRSKRSIDRGAIPSPMQLDNFQDVCITKDERVEQHLNKQFKNTELNYGHEQLSSKRIPKDSAVDTSRRIEQVGNPYSQTMAIRMSLSLCL